MGSEKKMTTELEKIDKKILKLNKELRPLENKRHKLKKAEEFDEAKELVSKCFVYRNSYGGNETWPMYVRVLRVTKHGELRALEIQKTPRGIEIELVDKYLNTYQCSSYKKISLKRFQTAYAKLIKKIQEGM